ncbi:hypothetical protein BH09PSE4_BH09PSE4_09470 [soil metagenome]
MKSTIRGAIAATIAAAMLTVPTVALAAPQNPAASLSVAPARVGAPKGASKAAGSTLINIAILGALVAGVLVATKKSSPDSP